MMTSGRRWLFRNGENHTALEDAILEKIDAERAQGLEWYARKLRHIPRPSGPPSIREIRRIKRNGQDEQQG